MGKPGKCFNAAFYSSMLIIIVLQFVSTVERQVFDFLGFMWAPIIANFFNIICVILGGFGTYYYRAKFVAVYSTWSLIWLGWNVFVICLYLEVGVLSRKRDLYILSIGTKNKSWWLENGIGCTITNSSWKHETGTTVFEGSRSIPPEDVIKGCLLDYYYVEVIHAGVQCLLALVGFIFSCLNMHIYADEEESSCPANDELEFAKMYKSPSRASGLNGHLPGHRGGDGTNYQCDNPTYEETANEYPTLERPPSYETSMRDGTVINNYYASDRQSVRSLRSVRSKTSNKSKSNRTNDHRPKDLPWVQITPSSSGVDAPFRHYP